MRSMTERGKSPKTNSQLLKNARTLRKEMTPQEKKLWYDFLRYHYLHWYKQRVFGNYILDFYCPKAKLAIELDGSQHYTESGLDYDGRRTEFLREQGISVMRIINPDVDRNFEAVCRQIEDAIEKAPLSQLR